ncbi:hypothetical protein VPH35_108093 [Triticum aestivum]
MPRLEDIINTCTEWALHLLNRCTEKQRLPVIMTLWRSWHVRNEVVHQKPAPAIEASRRFLCSYIDNLRCIQQHPHEDIIKGKMICTQGASRNHMKMVVAPSSCTRPPEQWTKPPQGWVKLNVDGAWREEYGTGGAGMILRDHNGSIIFSSCRFLTTCVSALEAEMAACMEGITLTLEWSTMSFILETDSSVAANMIKEEKENRSPVAALVGETKRLLALGREHVILHVSRDLNKVSHYLAQIGHSTSKTAVWLRCGPDEIGNLCQQDCNNLP